MNFIINFLLLTLIWSFPVAAQNLDQPSEQALHQTLQLLKSSSLRGDYIQKDSKAKQADDFAMKVAGNNKNKQTLYELAAMVMKELTKLTHGDPQKMKKVLQDANGNPKDFFNSWSPESKKALQELAEKIGPHSQFKD